MRMRFDLSSGVTYDTADVPTQVVPGRLSYGITELSPTHQRFHVEALDPYPTPRVEPPNPLLIRAMVISIPDGWTIWRAAEHRIVPYMIGETQYRVNDENVWLVHSGSNSQARTYSTVPGSSVDYYLAGGTRMWIDVYQDGHDPYAPPIAGTDAPEPNSPAGLFASFVGMGDPTPEGFSRLPEQAKRAVSIFKTRTDTEHPYCYGDWVWGADPAPNWYGQPVLQQRFSWDAQYGDAQGGLRGLLWYGYTPWGQLSDAAHYEAVAACLENYIWTRDPGAWDLAVIIWRRFMQSFLVTHTEGEKTYAENIYEKTGGVGEYAGEQWPVGKWSHTWYTNSIPMAKILGDPMALELCQAQWDWLRDRDKGYIWNSAGGCRSMGWALRNARLCRHYGYEGALDRINVLIEHTFASHDRYSDGRLHWINRTAHTRDSAGPWMNAILDTELIACMSTGASTARWGQLMTMVRWQINRFVLLQPDGSARVVFDSPDTTDPSRDTFLYQRTEAAWWSSLLYLMKVLEPQSYTVYWDAIQKTYLAHGPYYSIDYAVGGGPAAFKSWLSERIYHNKGLQWGLELR